MKRRVLGFGSCCYHVVSRITEQRFYLVDNEKELFFDLLNRVATFSGVEILTFCIMSNHFHLLLRIRAPQDITDKELLRRLNALYSPKEYELLLAEYQYCADQSSEGMLRAFRKRFTHRMHNLSEFMSTLKQRFSIRYNKEHERQGPLWNGRFKSVLVQSAHGRMKTNALSTMAAYIDLNAVRAGLVDDPGHYRWCGYFEAVRGNRKRIRSLKYVLKGSQTKEQHGVSALKTYSDLLARVISYDKHAPPLNSRIHPLINGWVLGDRRFVEFVTHRRPECFPVGRRHHSVPVSELPEEKLYVAIHSLLA